MFDISLSYFWKVKKQYLSFVVYILQEFHPAKVVGAIERRIAVNWQCSYWQYTKKLFEILRNK